MGRQRAEDLPSWRMEVATLLMAVGAMMGSMCTGMDNIVVHRRLAAAAVTPSKVTDQRSVRSMRHREILWRGLLAQIIGPVEDTGVFVVVGVGLGGRPSIGSVPLLRCHTQRGVHGLHNLPLDEMNGLSLYTLASVYTVVSLKIKSLYTLVTEGTA